VHAFVLNRGVPHADTPSWDVVSPLTAEQLRRGSLLNIMAASAPVPSPVTGQTPEADTKEGKKVTD
jgi:hypothetical protein